MTGPPTAAELNTRLHGQLPERDASAVAAEIDADATVAVSGFGSVGDPKAVPAALARSVAAGARDLELTIVSGGSVGGAIDTDLIEAGAVVRRYPYQATPTARAAANDRSMAFADRGIAGLSDEVRFGRLVDPDIALIEAVAVGEDWLVPSTSIGQTPAYVRAADDLIVEVNAAQPLALARFHDVFLRDPPPGRQPLPVTRPGDRIGGPALRFDPAKLRAIVWTDARDDPYEFREPTTVDEQIAANLLAFLEREHDCDPVVGAAPTLQFGVGSLGNALMSALTDSSLTEAGLRYYGEVIQDGLLDLLDAGLLEAASATSLALSSSGQDRLFAAADAYADDVILRPSDVSNAPELIDRFGVVAVNSAVGVDLYGHVNSTHVDGSKLINGVGGSVDFNRNAHLTVVALPATAADGELSTIVPMVTHVDHTEHDTDVIVTEHGVADLRGRAPVERAEAVIACADPAFRPQLREYLDRAKGGSGHLPHDLNTAFDWY